MGKYKFALREERVGNRLLVPRYRVLVKSSAETGGSPVWADFTRGVFETDDKEIARRLREKPGFGKYYDETTSPKVLAHEGMPVEGFEFPCPFCSEAFPDIGKLKGHCLGKHGANPTHKQVEAAKKGEKFPDPKLEKERKEKEMEEKDNG